MKKLLLLLFPALIAFPALAQNSTTAPRSISVVGSAEIEIVPDEIYVSVTLREFTKDKKKYTIEELEKAFVNFVEKETGVTRKEIKMDNMDATVIALKRKSKDAVLQNTYEIKYSKPAQVNTLFAAMDSLNISNAYVVRYSHSKMDEYKKQIKINAMKAAKEKATYMLEAIGSQCGKPLEVHETTGYVTVDGESQYPQIRNVMQKYSNSSSVSGLYYDEDKTETTIGGKTIKLRYEVNCTFEII
jgi:uncharacterized protein